MDKKISGFFKKLSSKIEEFGESVEEAVEELSEEISDMADGLSSKSKSDKTTSFQSGNGVTVINKSGHVTVDGNVKSLTVNGKSIKLT